MSDELIAFVRAQLDEDERVAREATPQGVRDLVQANMDRFRVVRHVAHWEPDRVLGTPDRMGEVAAKRRILDELASCDAQFPDWDGGYKSGLQDAVGILAQPYAGREGWQEEWRC